MKYVKEIDYHLDEMAKAWPVDAVVKCSTLLDMSKNEGGGWSSWKPEQLPGTRGGTFYMKITESGRDWLVGRLVYQNCVSEVMTTSRVRFRVRYAEPPTSEFKLFEKNKEEISKLIGKSFYIDGTESGIMGHDGKKLSYVAEAEYTIMSLNFKLSDLYDEPVFCLFSKGNDKKSFSVKMSEIVSLTTELSSEQKEVIADWFSSKLGGNITVNKSSHSDDRDFEIFPFKITVAKNSPFPCAFSANSFVTKKQAEDVIEVLRKQTVNYFDTEKLTVSSENMFNGTKCNIETLKDLAKNAGIEVSMKMLLKLRRGAATGKSFGL